MAVSITCTVAHPCMSVRSNEHYRSNSHTSLAVAPKGSGSVVSSLPVIGSRIVRLNTPLPPSVGRSADKHDPSSVAVVTNR